MAELSWYQRNREKALAEMRARRATPEGRLKRQLESRRRREKHATAISAQAKRRYANDPEFRHRKKAQATNWVTMNKQRRKQWLRHYWRDNADRLSRELRRYRSSPSGKITRQRYESRPEVRARTRMLRRQWWPQYYRKNREHLLTLMRPRRLAYMTRRRSQLRTTEEEKAAIQQFIVQTLRKPEVLCSYCGLPAVKREFDHAIPLSRGGQHVLANIRIACEFCNRSKHNKTPEEFMRDRKEVGI